MSRTKNRRRGSILVFILVVIVVISVLSLRLIEEGSDLRRARRNNR